MGIRLRGVYLKSLMGVSDYWAEADIIIESPVNSRSSLLFCLTDDYHHEIALLPSNGTVALQCASNYYKSQFRDVELYRTIPFVGAS